MRVVTVVRATMKAASPEEAQQTHDGAIITQENITQFRAAGNVAHRTFLNPANPREMLALDTWEVDDPTEVAAFYAAPEFAAMAGSMVEGTPEVSFWHDSGWANFE